MTQLQPPRSYPPALEKYVLYTQAVQAPDAEVAFIESLLPTQTATPIVLREDFCGSHALSCMWVQMRPQDQAIGVDLDTEPLRAGEQLWQSQLSAEQRQRLRLLQGDVLHDVLPRADVVVAVNFSYFIFKKRADLKQYFMRVRDSLTPEGLFVMDCFGGSACHQPNEEELIYEEEGFSYFWDQDTYDPITGHSQFYIHFQRPGGKKFQAFSYDWRLWSLPELRDLLEECGMQVTVYWEGVDDEGDGNGVFTPAEEGEACDAWVAYLVARRT